MSKGISETAFSSQVFDLLNLFQWRWCHIRPAFSSKGYRTPIQGHDPDGFKGKGLPDIIAVKELLSGEVVTLFAELKSEDGKLELAQRRWIELLIRTRGSAFTFIWIPSQFEQIVEVLQSEGLPIITEIWKKHALFAKGYFGLNLVK